MRPTDVLGVSDFSAVSVPVDAHVHFRRLDLVGPTLDAAAGNFMRVGPERPGIIGVLMLVESSAEHVFEPLAGMGAAGRWRLSRVESERQSLLASSGGRTMLIVRGQQISCADGLEVLALGVTKRYPSGASMEDAIGSVLADGHIAVIPWGFLKWRGARSERIRAVIAGQHRARLFFGDNGGRLSVLGMPPLLREAVQAGFGILAGTDPFPFASDYRRVGAFGSLADVELGTSCPWTTLRRWLLSGSGRPRPYGRALGPLRFAFNQGWIQVQKRKSSRMTT